MHWDGVFDASEELARQQTGGATPSGRSSLVGTGGAALAVAGGRCTAPGHTALGARGGDFFLLDFFGGSGSNSSLPAMDSDTDVLLRRSSSSSRSTSNTKFPRPLRSAS